MKRTTNIWVMFGIQEWVAYADTVLREAVNWFKVNTVGDDQRRNWYSDGAGGWKTGRKLKALPKSVGTSVWYLRSFSLFHFTKVRKDRFKISGLIVKYIALDEQRLNSQHLIVKCLLLDWKKTIDSQALIDCVAYRFAFINENLRCQHSFSLWTLNQISSRPSTWLN